MFKPFLYGLVGVVVVIIVAAVLHTSSQGSQMNENDMIMTSSPMPGARMMEEPGMMSATPMTQTTP